MVVGKRIGSLIALAVLLLGLMSAPARAQDPPPEPLPAGIPELELAAAAYLAGDGLGMQAACGRRNGPGWRMNFVARSKESQ